MYRFTRAVEAKRAEGRGEVSDFRQCVADSAGFAASACPHGICDKPGTCISLGGKLIRLNPIGLLESRDEGQVPGVGIADIPGSAGHDTFGIATRLRDQIGRVKAVAPDDQSGVAERTGLLDDR
jgi:hypothetical protein